MIKRFADVDFFWSLWFLACMIIDTLAANEIDVLVVGAHCTVMRFHGGELKFVLDRIVD